MIRNSLGAAVVGLVLSAASAAALTTEDGYFAGSVTVTPDGLSGSFAAAILTDDTATARNYTVEARIDRNGARVFEDSFGLGRISLDNLVSLVSPFAGAIAAGFGPYVSNFAGTGTSISGDLLAGSDTALHDALVDLLTGAGSVGPLVLPLPAGAVPPSCRTGAPCEGTIEVDLSLVREISPVPLPGGLPLALAAFGALALLRRRG